MAKKKSSSKETFTLEQNLAMTNAELTSNWAKFASFIRQVEGGDWDSARIKAIELLDKQTAIEYIQNVRSGSTKESTPKVEIVKDQKSTKVAPPSPSSHRDQYSMNYRRLLKIAPDIERRLIEGEEIYGKSVQTGLMDFNLELYHTDRDDYFLAISHLYKQNGDLVPDPDMVIRFNIKHQLVEALTFQNSMYYRTVYKDFYTRDQVNLKEKKSQNSYLTLWLRNLIDQGHKIEWKHDVDENRPEPKPRGEKSTENKKTDSKPDISYMDKSVISDLKESFRSAILDDVIQLYLRHRDGEQEMYPIAQYFAVERLLDAPMDIKASYPSDSALKEDYDRLKEFDAMNREIDAHFAINDPEAKISQATIEIETPTVSDKAVGNHSESTEIEEEDQKEVEDTVKHWSKLASVIREVEGIRMTKEKSKEKALKLKKEGKAEAYVVKAIKIRDNAKMTNLFKTNYQLLIRLMPDLDIRVKNDQTEATVTHKDKTFLSYDVVPASQLDGITFQIAMYEEGGKDETIKGTIMIAIKTIRQMAWVTLRIDKFQQKEDYNDEAHLSTSEIRYTANILFGRWLNTLLNKGFKTTWATKKLEEIDEYDEQTKVRSIEREQVNEKFPIVIEWTEGSAEQNIGINDLDELRNKLKTFGFTDSPNDTYIKNKVCFRGYPHAVRIDLSQSKGDYNPFKDDLIAWLEKAEPNYDWSQFEKKHSEQKKATSQDHKKDEIPDFEVGKVEFTEAHKRAGLKQKDINWINKHKQGMVLTPRTKPLINNTINIESDLAKQAKQPGLRISATGKLYYEGRSNRSDRSKHGF